MHDDVEQTLIAPRYLAGSGDPAWITVPLHRASGWSHGHDPLMPRVYLSSLDQKALLCIDPDPDGPWWSIQHAPAGGSRPGQSASVPAHRWRSSPDSPTPSPTPVLRQPAVDPYEPLRRAGWRDTRDGDGLTSPHPTA